MSIIELRSDTFTKPTKEMLEYMFNAKVGDDVWEEDYTVKALEEKACFYVWNGGCFILPFRDHG